MIGSPIYGAESSLHEDGGTRAGNALGAAGTAFSLVDLALNRSFSRRKGRSTR
jgi:hypothetical protein